MLLVWAVNSISQYLYGAKYLVDDGINEILTHLQISNENSSKSTKDLGNYTINI